MNCISELPIYEITTTAAVSYFSVTLDILEDTYWFPLITEWTFPADKDYVVKKLYNQISRPYNRECIIPLNKRNTKNPSHSHKGILAVKQVGLAMWKDGKFFYKGHTRQKFCCSLKNSKNEVCSCRHKNFYNGKKHHSCTKYIIVSDESRLFIDRNS